MTTATIHSIRDAAAVARGRRLTLGLSQAELSIRARVSRQWISAFESGKPGAELQLVLRLFDALGLRLLIDAGGDPDPNRAPSPHATDLDALLDDHGPP